MSPNATTSSLPIKKVTVPLLYALATSNILVRMDILDFIDIKITPVATGRASSFCVLKAEVDGTWTQEGGSGYESHITVTYNGKDLTFKRLRMATLLKENLQLIREQVEVLTGRRETFNDLKKKRPRDEDVEKDVASVDADQRKQRNAIWADAHREMVVSGDRLYAFVRVMAGTLNEDVTAAIQVEDRSLDAAQQEYRKQRSELIRQQRMFSQRIINELLNSVFKSSNFRIDLSQDRTTFENQIVVVNDESIEKVRQLSDTQSVQFLSTNVDLIRAFDDLKGEPLPLKEFVDKIQTIIHTENTRAQAQLARTQYQRDQNSLDYLSEPRNSFVIRLKNEAFAAIRRGFHEFQNEWRARRIPVTPPSAWELVEGGTDDLTDAFAQYCAYLWSNSRLFSSSTAAFIGVTPAKINLIVLRTALEKLVRRAYNYLRDPNRKPVDVPRAPEASEIEKTGDGAETGGTSATATNSSYWGERGQGFMGPGAVWNW